MNINELYDRTKNLIVLYVEDDNDVQKKVKRTFEQLFKHVDIANDGLQALRAYEDYFLLNNSYYDIVITDIKMPTMDGIELSKAVKKLNADQQILVISAHNDFETLQNLINIGVSTYIHKPIQFDELIRGLVKISNALHEYKHHESSLKEVTDLNRELDNLVDGFDSYVIASRTDLNGNITYVSKALENVSGYTKEELLGQPHNILKHPDTPKEIFIDMWKTIKDGKVWKGEIKNRNKKGEAYYIKAIIAPYYDSSGELIGYSSIRQDITAKKELELLNEKINTLLNNAEEGFLSFDSNMIIDRGYSQNCLSIFNESEIENLNILNILFDEDEQKKSLFTKGIQNILKSSDLHKKDLFLSLLPNETNINNKIIDIKCKCVGSDHFMLILSDITHKKELESKLDEKKLHEKMVLEVVANIDDFLEIKIDYQKFISKIFIIDDYTITLAQSLQDFKRELHTFKGVLYQMQLIHSPEVIHQLENMLSNLEPNSKGDYTLKSNENIKLAFDKDLEIITSILGKDYFINQRKQLDNTSSLINIKTEILKIIKDSTNINYKLQNIVSEIEQSLSTPLSKQLKKHISVVSHLSKLLNKPLNPLIVEGDETLKVPPKLKPFIRNLIHIYKNALDHGIEDIEDRVKNNKPEYATIKTTYEYINHSLIIIISDDGKGVDIEKIKQRAKEQKLVDESTLNIMSDKDVIEFIFHDNFSTKNDVDKISGRGIGLASLKNRVQELGGKIVVENSKGNGIKFIFELPLTLNQTIADNSIEYKNDLDVVDSIANRFKLLIEDIHEINVIDVKYIDKPNYSNKVHAIINLKGELNARITLSYSRSFLQNLLKLFVPFEIEESEKEAILDELPNEVINTIVGLAIQDFPINYQDTLLELPRTLTDKMLEKINANTKNRFITLQIQTTAGNIIIKLIKKG